MVMADPLEPDAGDDVVANETDGNVEAEPTRPARSGLRSLDRRTIGICVCVAVLFALVAAFVTSKVTEDPTPKDHADLVPAKVDLAKLLAVPLKTENGQDTTFQALVGTKPVLLNLWQQSCAPCVSEMPLLDTVHKSDGRVAVIGIDTQDRVGLAKQMAKQTKITYPWLRDPKGDFFYEAKGVGLPTSLLIDATGKKVLGVKQGPFDNRADVDAFLDKYLH